MRRRVQIPARRSHQSLCAAEPVVEEQSRDMVAWAESQEPDYEPAAHMLWDPPVAVINTLTQEDAAAVSCLGRSRIPPTHRHYFCSLGCLFERLLQQCS